MANRVNGEHGPHRRPVGGARTAVPSQATGGWARSAVARYASGAERCLLGLAHWRSLARSAASLSSLSDLSSPLPTVAALRVAHPAAPETGGRLTRSRETRSERIVHRCQLQFGEKRGSAIGPTRRGKGSKIMAISDGHGLPLAVHVASASPGETTLVQATLAQRFVRALPTRLIGDRGYDSDPLDRLLKQQYGIEMIAPNRPNRRTPTQDGRALRRYGRRWKIERLFAWVHNWRRIVTPWERDSDNLLGMIHLASEVILLRAFMR